MLCVLSSVCGWPRPALQGSLWPLSVSLSISRWSSSILCDARSNNLEKVSKLPTLFTVQFDDDVTMIKSMAVVRTRWKKRKQMKATKEEEERQVERERETFEVIELD